MRVDVPVLRIRWRRGLELALFVSTVVVCALSLFAHETPSKPLRLFIAIEATGLAGSTGSYGAPLWARAVNSSSPDDSDNDADDDDDDEDGLTAELPLDLPASARRAATWLPSGDATRSSAFTSRCHALRAPPSRSLS